MAQDIDTVWFETRLPRVSTVVYGCLRLSMNMRLHPLKYAHMATSATPEINKVALYALMLQSATSTELRDFCFRLEVTYESVVGPNDVVQTAIQKTINYFEARGRLPELLEQGEPAPDCVVQRAPRAKPEDSIVRATRRGSI